MRGRDPHLVGTARRARLPEEALESRELLVERRDWATQPQFVYRHDWKPGDMVMWDNTGTLHRARPYDPECGRRMHRTTLQGEEPFS
jgi:alpha-ketoglutarate-dependent taurine dioxygenase